MNWTTILIDYKNYLKLERGLSDNTISNYEYDIKRFISFLNHNSNPKSPTVIKDEDVQQFIYKISKEFTS